MHSQNKLLNLQFRHFFLDPSNQSWIFCKVWPALWRSVRTIIAQIGKSNVHHLDSTDGAARCTALVFRADTFWCIFDIYICHVNAGPSGTLAASDEKPPECEEPTALWARPCTCVAGKHVIDSDSWFGFMLLSSLGPFNESFDIFLTSFNRTSKSESFNICPGHVPLCFVCFGRSITWASLMDEHNGIGISGSKCIVFWRFSGNYSLYWISQVHFWYFGLKNDLLCLEGFILLISDVSCISVSIYAFYESWVVPAGVPSALADIGGELRQIIDSVKGRGGGGGVSVTKSIPEGGGG